MARRSIQEGKVKLPDGNMHYLATGQGPAVVLLHSLGSSVASWSEVLEPLAERHTVYAVDTMGQGDSDKPCRDYSIADYGRSVLDFPKAKGVDRATVMGNSIGALFAIEIAAAAPEKVDRLVLVGCPCRETEQERQEGLEMGRARFNADGSPRPRSREDLGLSYANLTPELEARVNADWLKAGVWAWKASVAISEYELSQKWGKLRCPVLIVYGEKDLLRAKEQVMLQRIKGSRLAVIPGAGHSPQVDDPRAFLEVVLPFLG